MNFMKWVPAIGYIVLPKIKLILGFENMDLAT